MAKTKQEVITDLKSYINNNGGKFGEWFVSVTGDANASLLSHKLNPKLDKWVFRTAPSFTVAREVAYYFTKILGTDGNEGDGGLMSDKVYAYRKSERTSP